VRVRLLNLLLLAALLLASSRLLQLLREPAPALPPSETEAAAPSEMPGGDDAATAPPVEPQPESYDVIVARNPFSPTRGVVQPSPVAGAKPAAPPAPPPKLTLYGVVIVNGDRTAYIQEGAQESRPKKVKEKDHIGGGVVSAIRPDGVTVVFGGTEVSIPLRSPKDVPAAAGAPAAAARGKAPQKVQRRAVPTPPAPGQMPMPAAPGQPVMPTGQEPAESGMPAFPADAEPAEEPAGEEDVLPEEFIDGGEEAPMPIEEMME
jgi:hypothetical protein